jgi:hypothetical protein
MQTIRKYTLIHLDLSPGCDKLNGFGGVWDPPLFRM